MTHEETRDLLDREWSSVLSEGPGEPDPEIDRFVDSVVLSLRYAFLTQLLGKVSDHSRNLLSLQKGKGVPGAWNARTFSSSVVVPWVFDNHNVLGTSSDPYVGKPLRRPELTTEMGNVKNRDEWLALVAFFESLKDAGPDEIRSVFRRCLRSLARRLARQKFEYPVPRRISMKRMTAIVDAFLEEPSYGLRPLVVSSALMRVLGEAFSLFGSVRVQGLNEPDAASSVPGDIMCYDMSGEKIALVVEVKDHNLTLTELKATVTKALEGGNKFSNILFAVPGLRHGERDEIRDQIEAEWAAGLNVYQVDIRILAGAAFALLDEKWRPEFLKKVGEELDARGRHRHREKWRVLLSGQEEKSQAAPDQGLPSDHSSSR